MAKDFKCVVFAVAQLNRSPDQRDDQRPIMSDIRESGQIEQDAEVIMFLYRDEEVNMNSEEKGIAEIIVAKNRNGKSGIVKLRWDGEYTKFSNL